MREEEKKAHIFFHKTWYSVQWYANFFIGKGFFFAEKCQKIAIVFFPCGTTWKDSRKQIERSV